MLGAVAGGEAGAVTEEVREDWLVLRALPSGILLGLLRAGRGGAACGQAKGPCGKVAELGAGEVAGGETCIF